MCIGINFKSWIMKFTYFLFQPNSNRSTRRYFRRFMFSIWNRRKKYTSKIRYIKINKSSPRKSSTDKCRTQGKSYLVFKHNLSQKNINVSTTVKIVRIRKRVKVNICSQCPIASEQPIKFCFHRTEKSFLFPLMALWLTWKY